MAHFKLIGPGTDGLYKYGGASIELSSVGTSRWWATVRFKSQEIDFEARSSEEALEKAMAWVDAAPEHPRDFYGKPRPLGEAKRPGSKPKYRPSKAKKHIKVARVVPSHGAWRVEFEDDFSIQVHSGSGRSDLLYAMKPTDMSYEKRSPSPETRRDYQYLALKAVLGDRPADFVIDHDGDVMAYLKDTGAVGEARRPKITTVTYSMPVYWASYLINGDASGTDDDDIAQADAAIADIGLGAPVDVGDSEFRHSGDYGRLAGDYADYTFIDHGKGAREAKLAAPRPGASVRDYIAVDNRGRTIAGPFKSFSDAKSAAGGGGTVKFVPSKMSEARNEVDDRRRGYHGPRFLPGNVVRVIDGDSMYRGEVGRIVTPDANRTVHLDNYNRQLLQQGALLVERRNGSLFVVFPNVLERENENTGAHEARRGGTKADPRAVAFFFEHAGYGHGPGETPEQGRKRGAIALAKAEQEATARGWAIEWHEDPEGWDSLGDIDPDDVKEVLYAVLKDENGKVLASLGSIVDPDRASGRVVEAELALEALNERTTSEARPRPKAKRSARRRRR
jgi:hypothetical protein